MKLELCAIPITPSKTPWLPSSTASEVETFNASLLDHWVLLHAKLGGPTVDAIGGCRTVTATGPGPGCRGLPHAPTPTRAMVPGPHQETVHRDLAGRRTWRGGSS